MSLVNSTGYTANLNRRKGKGTRIFGEAVKKVSQYIAKKVFLSRVLEWNPQEEGQGRDATGGNSKEVCIVFCCFLVVFNSASRTRLSGLPYGVWDLGHEVAFFERHG
jgi:hypothetical protein